MKQKENALNALLVTGLLVCAVNCQASSSADSVNELRAALSRLSAPSVGSRISVTTDGRGTTFVQESLFGEQEVRTRLLVSVPSENTSELLYFESQKGKLRLWVFEEQWVVFSDKDIATAIKKTPEINMLVNPFNIVKNLVTLALPDADLFTKIGTVDSCGTSEKWVSSSTQQELVAVYVSKHKSEGFPFICKIERIEKAKPDLRTIATINENTFVVVVPPINAKRGSVDKLTEILQRDLEGLEKLKRGARGGS